MIFYYGQPLGMNGTDKETTTPGWEFYGLQIDPHELYNAYHDPQYQSIIQKMKKELLVQKHLVKDDADDTIPVMQQIFKDYWNK